MADEDELLARLDDVGNRVGASRTRIRSGAGGQTMEATSKATFHEISAWDLEVVYDAAAAIRRLRAERDARDRLARTTADTLALWQRPSHIRLYAGEMTAQEMRSVLAVVGAISRALTGDAPDAG